MNNSYQNHFKNLKKTQLDLKKGHSDFSIKKSPSLQKPKMKISKSELEKSNFNKRQKKDSSTKMSLVAPFWLLVGLVATSWGYLNLDLILNFVDKVEFSALPSTMAADEASAKNSPTKDKKEEKSSETTPSAGGEINQNLNSAKEENQSYFGKLNDRKKELDVREKELNELEAELQKQRDEVEARIRKLEEIRAQIGQVLKDKVEVDEERVKKLVEFYSDMKPQNAAQIIATLNEDLAVEILGRMKKKNAADILNLLKADKAQVLTEKFAGYKRR
jgi:flagellar motility protein MotE (MotC chaperone)